MITQTQFNFNVDRSRVINSISSYWDLPDPEIIDSTFESLQEDLSSLINPLAIYKFQKKPRDYKFNFLESSGDVFFCALTLGNDSTIRVNELFNQNKMFEAILMDAMESVLLFEYINQFQDRIMFEAKDMGLGLTCRICPGDGEIPIEYQGDILERIGDTKKHGIHIAQGYLLNPTKSMSFVYGADKNIALESSESGCGCCHNKYCSMRKN